MVTASTPGTVRSRSTSARCACRPRASSYPARAGSTSTSSPPSRRKPGIGRGRRDRAHHEQSTGREQEQRERDLADDQGIADPHASRPASFVAGVPLEIRRGRATGQRQAGQAPKTSVATRLNPTVPTKHSPVETEFGKAQRRRGARDAATPAAPRSPTSTAATRPRLRPTRGAILR